MGPICVKCKIHYLVFDALLQLLFFLRHVYHLYQTLHGVGALLVA